MIPVRPMPDPSAPIPGPVASPAHPRQGGHVPVLRLGFRPFYLAAAAYAVLVVPLWLAVAFGIAAPPVLVHAAAWHAHEMIFGFASAVIAGFLLTAARQWTGLPTPVGPALAALVALWAAGRVVMWTGPALPAALIDCAFLPAVAVAVLRVLARSGNTRNYPLVALLGAMTLANGLFHFASWAHVPLLPERSLNAALFAIVTVAMVIAGRVVPSFTAAALPGVRPRGDVRVDRAALLASLATFVAVVFDLPAAVVVPLALVSAAAHAWRAWGWRPGATRRVPLLWILHLSYAWIPAGFVLLATAAAGWTSPLAAFHAFGMGAIGGLVIGMITRTALGHTGRRLRAGPAETSAYVLVLMAALVRVGAVIALPDLYAQALVLSGAAFAAAFLIYLVVYAPWLMRARVDGKDG